MANYDAIIVGAGISGLTTGALLCHQGKNVLILEKAPTLGGRFGSIQYRGHVLDDGAHMPSDTGHVERVFETLGLSYP
jgi:phytoene dehydrogenase-like protein